jgi:DUF4097 and DUF4098 domain-containing protein YvlB
VVNRATEQTQINVTEFQPHTLLHKIPVFSISLFEGIAAGQKLSALLFATTLVGDVSHNRKDTTLLHISVKDGDFKYLTS